MSLFWLSAISAPSAAGPVGDQPAETWPTLAERYRQQRDALIRRARQEDPGRWSYNALAAAIGCSKELIAAIIKHRA
jgi:ribosome-binding protein aMBF1 (putative translation factor)